MTPADLVHDWSAGTFTCPLCREVLHGRDRTDLCPTRVTRALATARAEAAAAGYARGRAEGLREAADLCARHSLHGLAALIRRLAPPPTPEPTPDPWRAALPPQVYAPEVTPGPLTNCDSCAHDYTDPPGAASHPHRWCAAYKKGDRRPDIDVWCRDNIGDHGAPIPGATGCPGYEPKPTPGPRVGGGGS